MTIPESAIQSAFHETLIRFGGPDLLGFSVPNEGSRGKSETGRLKAQGLLPGVCDYVVLWTGGGALIEFKTLTGRIQKTQKAFGDRAAALGWPYRVCRSWQEAYRFLQDCGAPLDKVLADGKVDRFVRRRLTDQSKGG